MHPRLVRCRSDALEDQRQLSGVRRQISPSKRRRGVVAVLGIFKRYLAALRECVAPQPHRADPQRAYDLDIKAERETRQSADIFRQLKLSPREHALETLFEGEWR